MAPTLITEDYYEVLEISQTADATTIKSSYRRLAKQRHPDKRPNDPTATAQFQLLQTAYDTLIDASEREIYDRQYPRIRSARQTTSGNGGASPYQTRTWTAGAAPQTGAQAQSPADDEESQRAKRRLEELRERLENLERRQSNLTAESSKAQQAMNRIQEALDRLQEEEDKDAQEEIARNSWFAVLFGSRVSPEEKEGRERRAAGRRTGRIVREAEYRTQKTKLEGLRAQLGDARTEIMRAQLAISMETRRETRRQQERQEAERHRQAAEARRKMEEYRKLAEERAKKAREAENKRREREEKFRQEEARKEREEEQRRQERREKLRQEQARKEREEEQRRQERREKLKQEQARIARMEREEEEEETRQKWAEKSRQEVPRRACQHRGWWPRVEERRRCGRCFQVTTKFAFQCPGCQMSACAACRIALREGR